MEVVRERHERLHRGVEAADRRTRAAVTPAASGSAIAWKSVRPVHLHVRTLFQAMADPEAAGVTAASCRAIRGFHATMESLEELVHVEVVRS